MTPESEQLEAQSRAAIKAWCDDPSVKLEFCDKGSLSWMLKDHISFHIGMCYYRIAKPRKFYRVGQDKDGQIFYVSNEASEKHQEARTLFDRWLDERKYYD